MSEKVARCEICGEPMPPGEEMFKYHGYSGPCPKSPPPPPKSLHISMAGKDFLLREHRGWWATIEKPELQVGDRVRFICAGEVVERGKVTEIIAPGTNWGHHEFNSWWKTAYDPEP